MKNILLIIVLLFFAQISTAQDKEIDSLLNKLKELKRYKKFEKDTNYIKTLNKLASRYRGINADSALQIASLSQKLSQKANYTLGYIEALLQKGQAYNQKGFYSEAVSLCLEAIKICENMNYYSKLSNAYTQLHLTILIKKNIKNLYYTIIKHFIFIIKMLNI